MQSLEQRAQALSTEALEQSLRDWDRRQSVAGKEADELIAKNDERYTFMISDRVEICKKAAEIIRTISEELAIRGAA